MLNGLIAKSVAILPFLNVILATLVSLACSSSASICRSAALRGGSCIVSGLRGYAFTQLPATLKFEWQQLWWGQAVWLRLLAPVWVLQPGTASVACHVMRLVHSLCASSIHVLAYCVSLHVVHGVPAGLYVWLPMLPCILQILYARVLLLCCYIYHMLLLFLQM